MSAADLFWIGIGLELVGLALVGASDYVPLARTIGHVVGRSLKRSAVSAWWRVARLFGRRRTIYASVSPGGVTISGGHITGIVSPGENATLEQKVEFLLRRSVEWQEALQDIERRLGELPAAWRSDIATARTELEARFERRLTETQERYLLARRIGLVCLLAGVGCVAASNVFSA